MFATEFYDKLDPSYREALRKLESEFKEPGSDESQNALADFARKYMITQELWNLAKNKFAFVEDYGMYAWGARTAAEKFFFKDITCHNTKCYDYEFKGLYIDIDDILFPCKDLDQRMELYEKKIYSFIPPKIRQRHEEMKALYPKIKEVEGDLDEWFAALVESDNVQFVRDNVEHKLGADLTDRTLWKKYINYLKEHGTLSLLEAYSKYCRFFTDDTEMMEEYRQAAVKQNRRIFVPWKNPFDFEEYDDQFWEQNTEEDTEEFEYFQYLSSQKEPLTIHFDGRNATKPQFPFLSPTMRYILDNASGDVLQKLFKSCKWFRAAKPINVCYKFEEVKFWGNSFDEINEQSIKSVNNSIFYSNLDQLFISTVFYYFGQQPNALSDLIPRIYRCTAKYVDIWNQNLSLKELQFLIGNAVQLSLANLKNSDENEFKLEDILQLTPKIKKLCLSGFACTAETSQKLCELEFKNKLERIYLEEVKSNLLDPMKFGEFIKNNCSAKATITIHFYLGLEEKEYIDRFCQIFNDAVNEKWNEDEKPKLNIR